MAPTVVIAASHEFVGVAVGTIADGIEASIVARGTCALALCGGTTPIPVYEALARRQLAWPDISVYFGDERAVPPDNPDSNFAMARRSLLDHVRIPPEQIHRMAAERPDLDRAASEYDQLLPPRFDLLLLGMGPDGHTASLFPYAPAVTEPSRRVVAAEAPPAPIVPPVARMTITPLVIAAARHIVVMVRGTDKSAILQHILEGPEQPARLPAQYARGGTWIIDQAAAAQLQSRDI